MEKLTTEVVVVGAGPGGYAAAFYAADKGKKVVLVEMDERLGGVCLNRGCIPSKAFLHASAVMDQIRHAEELGIECGTPTLNLEKIRSWKSGILTKLAAGIAGLAKKRGVKVLRGRGYFDDSNTLRVETEQGQQFIHFQTGIIAVGSRPAMPSVFDLGNKRVMTSTEALEMDDIPHSLLVVGGGYIGMELGTVYATLGSHVTLAEAGDGILKGADPDLVRPVQKFAQARFKEVRLNAKITKMATSGKKIKVVFDIAGKVSEEMYDKVLVSTGRTPNSRDLGLENTKVELDERGFIKVNALQQTADPSLYAIGDIAGGLLLAHKASKEAKIAVEVLCGESHGNTNLLLIPAVVFTHPEIAWIGLTETEAKAKNIPVKVAKFPWGASGRAMTLNATEGLTKLVLEPDTERVLGVGIVGHGAGDLIGEGILALEMGATAHDIAHTIHPHPTLSETMMEAAEVFYGVSTHISK